MSASPNLVDIIRQTLSMVESFNLLVKRVESLEDFSNQQSILVDTLGDIMEELKKQEH